MHSKDTYEAVVKAARYLALAVQTAYNDGTSQEKVQDVLRRQKITVTREMYNAVRLEWRPQLDLEVDSQQRPIVRAYGIMIVPEES